MLTDEGMRHAASRAEQAADNLNRAVGSAEDIVRRLEHLFMDGYGGNALRLIELLESNESKTLENEKGK